jgi:hypothetical protein
MRSAPAMSPSDLSPRPALDGAAGTGTHRARRDAARPPELVHEAEELGDVSDLRTHSQRGSELRGQPREPRRGREPFGDRHGRGLTVREAAEQPRLAADTAITVNSLCPGLVQTDLTPVSRSQAPLTAAEAGRFVAETALLCHDRPTGRFLDRDGTVAW